MMHAYDLCVLSQFRSYTTSRTCQIFYRAFTQSGRSALVLVIDSSGYRVRDPKQPGQQSLVKVETIHPTEHGLFKAADVHTVRFKFSYFLVQLLGKDLVAL